MFVCVVDESKKKFLRWKTGFLLCSFLPLSCGLRIALQCSTCSRPIRILEGGCEKEIGGVFFSLTFCRLPQEDWTPSVDELRLIQSVVGHKSWPEIRDAKQIAFCKHCNRHRPLRAHHCSDCNRCVLKQDHHCPWVTNCVGHHNHKYFVNFMGHGILGLAYVLLWVIVRAFQVFNGEKLPSGLPNIAPGTVITMAVDGILSVSLMLAISMLFSYQMWLLGINSTTIEHYDYSRRKRYAKKHGTKFIYPFSHGWKNNLRTILGRSYVDWVSTSKTEGDGLHEEISHEFLHSLDKGQTHFNVFEPDSEDTRKEQNKRLEKIV